MEILDGKAEGTYLFRYSDRMAPLLAVSYVYDQTVHHSLIEYDHCNGFRLADGSQEFYASLKKLAEAFDKYLKKAHCRDRPIDSILDSVFEESDSQVEVIELESIKTHVSEETWKLVDELFERSEAFEKFVSLVPIDLKSQIDHLLQTPRDYQMKSMKQTNDCQVESCNNTEEMQSNDNMIKPLTTGLFHSFGDETQEGREEEEEEMERIQKRQQNEHYASLIVGSTPPVPISSAHRVMVSSGIYESLIKDRDRTNSEQQRRKIKIVRQKAFLSSKGSDLSTIMETIFEQE